jgi:hypothetical protein
MQFADRWGMEGVPDDKEGALYDPYDEQRLLELEDGDDVTMLTIPEDSLLNSSADEDVVPVDPNTGKDVAPEPVARPDDTQTAPAQPPTGTETREAVAAGPADKPPTTRSDDSAAKPRHSQLDHKPGLGQCIGPVPVFSQMLVAALQAQQTVRNCLAST